MKYKKNSIAALLAVTTIFVPTLASASSTTLVLPGLTTVGFVAPNPPNTSEILAGGNASSAPFRYSNVVTISGTQIDALVSIVSLSNSESADGLADNKMDRIDDNDNNSDLELSFRNSNTANGLEGHVVFDIQLVLGGTSTPVTLQNVAVTVKDVDNNQFVQFSGLDYYNLAANRSAGEVEAYTGNASFTAHSISQSVTVPAGSVLFFASANGSSSNEHFTVEVRYANLSNLRVKAGSFEMDSMSLDFTIGPFFSWVDPQPITAVVQPAFTKSYDANSGTGTPPAPVSGSGALTVSGISTSPSISKTGYVFSGWNTRADGTGVSYAPGSSIIPVADITLYAVWSVAPTPTPTPTPVAAAPQLARTGAGEESVMFGFAGITAILIAVGSMLLYRRRNLS